MTRDRPDLSSERAPHMDKTVTVKQEQISGHKAQKELDIRNKYLVIRPRRGSTSRRTDSPPVLM
jgi:hypothetical protein